MKLTSFYCTVFLFSLSFSAFAQTNYPAGVYMSKVDLLEKKPSQQYNLEVIPYNNDYAYRVISPDKSIKRKIINREIWAVSDGERLYINGNQIQFEAVYLSVLDEGKYLLYVGSMTGEEAGMVAFGGGLIGSAIASASRWLYAWNPETGQNYKINKAALEEWLKKTPWLLNDYLNEEFPKDMNVLIKYAALRNAAYAEEDQEE